jgi:putative transposase
MIARHRSAFPVGLMCRVLAVARSGFYAWARRPSSARALADRPLQVGIAASHRRSVGTYGSPRILRDLQAAGHRVGRKRVARLMAQLGLVGVTRRRFRRTTQSDHAWPIAPNLLDRQFAVAAPNQAWVADVTYCWTHEGWLYLAVVLDLHSRRIVGWATRARLDRVLVQTALARALAVRGGVRLHHSDRGRPYASHGYRAVLAAHGVTVSMSRRGDCYDNAVVESFFSTVKRELLERQPWATRAGTTAALGEYIDGWYNPYRRHSHLGYLSPAAFEQQLRLAA